MLVVADISIGLFAKPIDIPGANDLFFLRFRLWRLCFGRFFSLFLWFGLDIGFFKSFLLFEFLSNLINITQLRLSCFFFFYLNLFKMIVYLLIKASLFTIRIWIIFKEIVKHILVRSLFLFGLFLFCTI